MIELFLGGSRSGKSKLAEQAAADTGLSVIYLATATGDDQQMRERIEAHQNSRPQSWQLLEEPFELAQAIEKHAASETCLLVDCLTLWLTNCLFKRDLAYYEAQKQQLLQVLETSRCQIILVSNETNMGVIPLGQLSRDFCDQAGLLHQQVAALSDKVTLAVAGLPLSLKG
ncbi:bifunctional adenosylcobinamide kinase/adenosylcobinamide-phosphate guanylyltransferase ['Osedax' symbiont bacterium Rs2_46_30_T18]|nr:bifunctional adenosylcobinamide kinase/adenosylcobinamide-phosphate guanylyltransferase ['Osedax' symbiont bacterium Rs2_46_30_T18]